MAKPPCSFCGENEAILLDSNLDDGETQGICGEHLPMYALTMAATLTVGFTVEQSEAYGELFDQIAANDARPRPKKTGRGGKSSSEVTSAPAADAPPTGSTAHDPSSIPSASETVNPPSQSTDEGHVSLPEPCPQCGGKSATGDEYKLTCDGCGTVLATADGN